LENIDAVLFDLDDTLLDRSKTFSLYCEYFIKNYFTHDILPREKEDIILAMKEMDKNGYENRTVFYKKIIDKWNLEYKTEKLEENFFEQFCKFSVPENKLIETIDYPYKKYKLAVITNGSSFMQNGKIDKLKIRGYFKEIIISGEVNIKKPDKDIFLLACNRLKVIPTEAVYIGDNYNIDILGANNAGLKGIWINKFKININYEHTINDLETVVKIL
jgi:putative hydrolase of the HAD superfamily